MSRKYSLEKGIWTDADFDVMGWHDATIHSVAFFPEAFEFALDLDYIFNWVDPETEGGYYSFWVAPVTMVFSNVHGLTLSIEPSEGLEIADIHREQLGSPRNAEAIEHKIEWAWKIDCREGEISLKSVGYRMYVRRAPMLQKGQSLDLEARAGVSFARPDLLDAPDASKSEAGSERSS